jgi:putative ABC transport system substrate-binding protein
VRSAGERDDSFAAMTRERSGALLVQGSSMLMSQRNRLRDLTVKGRLPSMCTLREYAEAGCLASYGVDFSDLYRRAAGFVDKILKGARPADLPVEQPTKFELVINLKTAKALGLTIPPSMLLRATQILE